MPGIDDFRDQPHHRARGKLGEAEAAAWLERNGYQILARNYTTRAGEIDLIGEIAGTLCFIEIKARASKEYGLAIEAITATKQKRLARAAAHYLMYEPWEGPCRFDVLGMDLEADGWHFTLIQNAFEVG